RPTAETQAAASTIAAVDEPSGWPLLRGRLSVDRRRPPRSDRLDLSLVRRRRRRSRARTSIAVADPANRPAGRTTMAAPRPGRGTDADPRRRFSIRRGRSAALGNAATGARLFNARRRSERRATGPAPAQPPSLPLRNPRQGTA